MITINNLEKILAINSQDVEIDSCNTFEDYYRFVFFHKNIHSAHFSVHMNRNPDSPNTDEYGMKLWDGISNNPIEYYYELDNIKDPFALLDWFSYVINDWDIITNK